MPIDDYVDAWSKGFFYARNMRLQDFLNELSRYRFGILRCDPAVADLRISGTFQINNTDQILSALPYTLPVSVRYQTAYWVSIHSQIN
jgi:transmembrane sensor